MPSALIFFFCSMDRVFGKTSSKQMTSSPPQMPSPGTTFESPGATIYGHVWRTVHTRVSVAPVRGACAWHGVAGTQTHAGPSVFIGSPFQWTTVQATRSS